MTMLMAYTTGLRRQSPPEQSLQCRRANSERLRPPELLSASPDGSYTAFVHEFISALRDRPFSMKSLDYFLDNFAEPVADTGEWAEFGVWTGKTITRICNFRKKYGSARIVHGFDSFIGLPNDWRNATTGGQQFEGKYLNKGSFNVDGIPPFDDPSKVEWHVGWFNTTAGAFAHNASIGNITFLHMDADMYSSTVQVFEALEHKLHPGVFIVFDEIIGYPEYMENELQAFYELLQRTGRSAKVIGYPGPYVIEDPEELRRDICKQGLEQVAYPQSALVQLM